MNDEEILALADEHEEWLADDKCVLNPITFYRAAFNAGLEAGAKQLEGPYALTGGIQAYAAAIRALEMK